MSYNRSPLAFDDIREAFDRAISSPRGIRIACTSRGAAVMLRSRFNYFRKLNRAENVQIYSADSPMWNRSVYDKLVLRIPPKGDALENILFIEPRSIGDLQIEEIGPPAP